MDKVFKMLAYIRGTVEELEQDAVILDHQGMGFRIYTSAMDIQQISGRSGEVTMHLFMNVREDDISLYGFLTKDELNLYKLLISVSGIGPKAALAILSALSVKDLQLAIISGDAKALTKANGVGMKGAQKVILELKDKIDLDAMLTPNSEAKGKEPLLDPEASDVVTTTMMALTSLGYSQMEAAQAVRNVKGAEDMTEEALLKAALKVLI